MKTRILAALAWLALASPGIAAQGSGCLPTTGTVSGLSMAQFINTALQAVISGNSGASAPSTDCTAAPVKGQVWLDTSVTPNVEKRYDGTSWVTVGAIDSSNHLWSPPVGGGMSTVTANTTTDICAAPAAVQSITGTTPITGFGSSCSVGMRKTVLFGSATPITHNAISLIVPGQRDYTASAGDVLDAIYLGAGNWRIVSITKADGSAVVNPSVPVGTVLYGDYGTIPAKTVYGTGQALSRASYPDYFAAVTRVQTGTLTAGNNTITGLANTAGFGAGMNLEGTGIPSGSAIVSVTSSSIVMSTTATANGSQSVRVFVTGYGTGGDSTTVGVKNCVGKVLAGRDPAGTTLGSAAALNTSLGAASFYLAQGQLPNAALSVSVSGNISVNSVFNGIIGNQVSDNAERCTNSCKFYSVQSQTINSQGFNSMTGSTSSINGGVTQSVTSNLQPTVTAECVVAVLP